MAYAYRESDPLLRHFAAWVVDRVQAHERPLIAMSYKLRGSHSADAWSIVAGNHSASWIKWCAEHDMDIPRPIKGSASTMAAGTVIASMLNAGDLQFALDPAI